MESKLIAQGREKTYALIFDTGDEVTKLLLQFAQQNELGASHFSGIGAFSEVVLGYFEPDKKKYKEIPIREQVEVLALTGDITLENGRPKVHAHVVVGSSDGTARGGHLLRAVVRPTLELIVSESPAHLHRQFDEAAGLALIRL